MRARAIRPILFSLALAACVTVNVYFPEGEIRDLSEQIEDEIRRQASDEAEAAPSDSAEVDDDAALRVPPFLEEVGASLFGAPVHAQDVLSPEVSNPAIRRIIDSRAGRLDEIDSFKSDGVIGENNRGLLEIRSLDAVSDLRARATVQRLVKDENADREQLYREIASATGVDPGQIPRIQETYAATIRSQSRPGAWIQMPDGSWRQK